MDHKEQRHEFQPLGLCNKFYNNLKFLPTHLLKLLTSSRFTPRGVADAPRLSATRTEANPKPNNAQVVPSIAQEKPPQEGEDMESKTNSYGPITTSRNEKDAPQVLEDNDIDATIQVQGDEEAEAPPDKAPKKMVSINENVETIKISKKSNKKLKLEEADQQMPLKSILKVPSDASNSQEPQRLLSRANGA